MAPRAMNQTDLAREVEARLGINARDVKDVLAALTEIAEKEVKAGRPFQIPGLVKITPRYKAATKARKGRNPATGEEVTISAKPATVRVTARVLSKVKKAAPTATSAAGKALRK